MKFRLENNKKASAKSDANRSVNDNVYRVKSTEICPNI